MATCPNCRRSELQPSTDIEMGDFHCVSCSKYFWHGEQDEILSMRISTPQSKERREPGDPLEICPICEKRDVRNMKQHQTRNESCRAKAMNSSAVNMRSP